MALAPRIRQSIDHNQLKLFLCKIRVEKMTLTMTYYASVIVKSIIEKIKTTTQDEYVEAVVCQESDIKENEMKAFDLAGAGKILLVKQNGRLSAIGAKCTHYGAPLETGVLGEGRVRCPWHGACFSITSGDIEDFPGMDSLPCYQVCVENAKVKVRAKITELQTNKRRKPMFKQDKKEATHYVVLGGGPAGANCVETLRQAGFGGKITLVCKENALPYDRIKLSKFLDSELKAIQLRDDAFYSANGIQVLKGVKACHLNAGENTVELSNGKVLNYNKIFIATGSSAMGIEAAGDDLKNIFRLRSIKHAKEIHSKLKPNSNVIIIGSSFIAMETAAYCAGKVGCVTVIARSPPFSKTFGPEVGAAIEKLFTSKGVRILTGKEVKGFCGNDKKEVENVIFTDSTSLAGDVVILGLGSCYNTDFLQDSGVNVRENGSVEVNANLQTNVCNVFAGGDLAYAPIFVSNEKANIGHFGLATYHGHIGGLNMADKITESKAVPFFWTYFFGKSIRYAGHGPYDSVKIAGKVEELKFVAYYIKDGKVIAVCSCGMDPLVAKYAELRSQGKELSVGDLGEDLWGWTKK